MWEAGKQLSEIAIALNTQDLLICIEKGYKNILSYSNENMIDKLRNRVNH